jgi:hypothetical protein
MPIACQCPACHEPFQLSDEQAGKNVMCAQCGAAFEVPALPGANADIPVVQAAVGPASASSPKRPRRRLSREDEPRPRQTSNALPWLLIGGLVCLLFLMIVVGGGLVFWAVIQAVDEEARAQEEMARQNMRRQAQPPVFLPPQNANLGQPPLLPQPKQGQNNPEKLATLQLQQGLSVARAKLDITDAIEPGRGYRKTYLIYLPAGRRYHILLESTVFDAYLLLRDSAGQLLAEDDDGAAPPPNLNALIDYTPAKAGIYRIVATTFAPGQVGDFTLTVRDLAGPAADAGKGGRFTIDVSSIALPADKLVEDLVWAPDGSAFFGLTSGGVLSRVGGNGFTVTKKVELAARCSCLSLSGEGLLATLPDAEEVCVIDPATLAVVKRIPAAGVERAVSAPKLKLAFAAGKSGVTVLDLTKALTANHFNKVPTRFARVSPDGKYYFAQGGTEQLCSYRIEGLELVEHQRTERIAQNGQCICISPDSRHVCLPSAGGNYGTSYATHVYMVENLKAPVFTVKSGAYPRVMGFDSVNDLVFAQNHEQQLLVFARGEKLAEFTVSPGQEEPKQFVPHPQGGKLLVLTDKTLLLVKITGK